MVVFGCVITPVCSYILGESILCHWVRVQWFGVCVCLELCCRFWDKLCYPGSEVGRGLV